MNISKRIADDFLAVGACKGYALIEIEAIVQRSVATLVDQDEVEMALAIISQHPLVASARFADNEHTYVFPQQHKLVAQPIPNQLHTHIPILP